MSVKVSRLNKRVTFQSFNKNRDSAAGFTDEWTDYATVYGNIQPVSGREYMEGAAMQVEITHNITIRYRSDIKRDMRVICNGRTFEIEHVINYNEANKYLVIKAFERT